MLKQKEVSENMSRDINEMEKMLNDYLQFARTQTQESTTVVNIGELLNSIKDKFDKNKLSLNISDKVIQLKGRPTALKRSFENIIQNGLTYGNKVDIEVQKGQNRILVIVEDDGPGIPEDQYKNVFKPFFRLDKSRSLNQSGVGLGLAIVEDIINSHGGNILLSKSKYNGLQVKISLPFNFICFRKLFNYQILFLNNFFNTSNSSLETRSNLLIILSFLNFKSVDISFLRSSDVNMPFSIKLDSDFKIFSELLITYLI